MSKLEGTWKMAADVLDVSVDTAQRQFRASKKTNHPMPIYQIGDRGRIRFDPEELLSWQRDHPKWDDPGKH